MAMLENFISQPCFAVLLVRDQHSRPDLSHQRSYINGCKHSLSRDMSREEARYQWMWCSQARQPDRLGFSEMLNTKHGITRSLRLRGGLCTCGYRTWLGPINRARAPKTPHTWSSRENCNFDRPTTTLDQDERVVSRVELVYQFPPRPSPSCRHFMCTLPNPLILRILTGITCVQSFCS